MPLCQAIQHFIDEAQKKQVKPCMNIFGCDKNKMGKKRIKTPARRETDIWIDRRVS